MQPTIPTPPTPTTQPTHQLIKTPWQKPPLTANQRLHHHHRAQLTADIRRTVWMLARNHHLPKDVTHARVGLHYWAPDRRRRDEDNLVPTLKACCDGLAAGTGSSPGWGLVPDDTPVWMTKTMPRIHPPEPGRRGEIWLEIDTWANDTTKEGTNAAVTGRQDQVRRA